MRTIASGSLGRDPNGARNMVVSRKGLGNAHDERHAVYVINYAEDVWINSGVLRDASQDGVLTAAVTTT